MRSVVLVLFVITACLAHENNFEDIYTPDDTNYKYFPISSKRTSFEVKAFNDAHIGLFAAKGPLKPWYEIVIGSHKNTNVLIRKDKVTEHGEVVTQASLPGLLNGNEYRGFWIDFSEGAISVGRKNERTPFIIWKEVGELPKINFIGVHTGYGAVGDWKLYK